MTALANRLAEPAADRQTERRYKMMQTAAKACFAKAHAFITEEGDPDNGRLGTDEVEEFLARLARLVPEGDYIDGPVLMLTRERTGEWDQATDLLRDKTIELYEDGNYDICREGMNEFLTACGLEEYWD